MLVYHRIILHILNQREASLMSRMQYCPCKKVDNVPCMLASSKVFKGAIGFGFNYFHKKEEQFLMGLLV
jgi:hypothetical protein